jgi:tryptophan-rich sensory protein
VSPSRTYDPPTSDEQRRTARSPGRDLLVLAGFVAAVVVVAVLGGLATGSAGRTYERLDLPAFAPPSWLFGPVWTVLYLMIAIAGWFYWRHVRRLDGALLLYGAQLVLNAAWTPLFFAADAYGAALVDIVLLAVLVLATAVAFARRSRPAAWLLAPYLLWVLYATALNAGIWLMN